MMGLAQSGVSVPSGTPLAIQGNVAAGVAIAGNVAYRGAQPIPPSTWELLKSINVVGPTTTTAPIDTTGAGLIVVQIVSFYQTAIGLSDSAGNTWTQTTSVAQPSSGFETSLFYCINPATSTAHTFSVNSGLYQTLNVMAFQTPGNVSFDQLSTNTSTAYAITLPALTPSAANSLLITGIGANYQPTAINQNFTIVASNGQISGQYFAGGVAYLIQNVANPVSPQWNIAPAATPYLAATMASFTPV